ncbi:PfkB family carbohydrate kinase [Zobellella maritima]|uniref:PfkB family carbohydrate kinase n=1 Tax=Zobellella maritima TaxID=2059725 RepID=UPI000E305F25|nr:PfkB family carbohydrate kinase [Zobellella maritima]
MAQILLLANLNCDHVLQLNESLVPGGRLRYRDQGRRLGGGAANTGVGLVWAGHRVRIASRVGNDDTGNWLCTQAASLGLDLGHVEQFDGETGELLILVDGEGERTILRQARSPGLPKRLPEAPVDCLYVNVEGFDAAAYMARMCAHSRVISQYPKGGSCPRPCHVLIASAADLPVQDQLWSHARSLAGEQLEWLVVTHGERGAEAFGADRHLQVPAPPVAVVDATGAGDAFAGGLIHGLVSGLDMSAALEQASQWAACTLSSSTSIPSEHLRAYLAGSG